MPYMINGIGTTYYGKKNLEESHGTCGKCGRGGVLKSYETRLWFVIFLIPIIPLGKKMILDYCSRCTGHRAIPLQEWERIKGESISQGREEMSSNPDDPQTAIRMHSRLSFFSQREEAEEIARGMAGKFKDNVDVQLYLGDYYDKAQKVDDADTCFERALALEPGNHAARRAVALGCIAKNELSRAADLLSFMRFSGPDQDPTVLYTLATAFQKNNNHGEALSYFEIMARDFPDIAKKNKDFRKAVKKSKQALGDSYNFLPRREFASTKKWKRAAVVVAVLAVLLLVLNWYLSNHRSLQVVNQLEASASITVPGRDLVEISPGERTVLKVPEGQYDITVQVQNSLPENVPVSIPNTLMDRVFGNTVYFLNVSRGAVFVWEETTYSENPTPNDPYRFKFYAGDAFFTVSNINYLFKPFPETVSLPDSKPVFKTRFDVFQGAPAAMPGILQSNGIPADKILLYLEAHLGALHEDEDLLSFYMIYAQVTKGVPRALLFLEKGLARRPVNVEWHRTYQSLSQLSVPKEKLIAQYDAMLEKEPGDSDLLYLRGRLDPDTAVAFTYYDRSIAANEKNSYPISAKAFHLAAAGDFAAARPLLSTAYQLKPDSARIKDLYYRLRFALGEYDSLEKEILPLFSRNPLERADFAHLMDLRIAQENVAGARDILDTYRKAVKKTFPQDPEQLVLKAQLELAYLQGDFAGITRDAVKLTDTFPRDEYLRIAYLNQGEMDQLEKLVGGKKYHGSYDCLLYWLGWLEKGDSQKASAWMDRAVEGFNKSSLDNKIIAEWLRQPGKDLLAQLDNLSEEIEYKRILYTAFARLYPQKRREFLARAEKMNYLIVFPYHFLAKIIKGLKNQRM